MVTPNVYLPYVLQYIGLHNINYQNKSDIVSATWHGFTDTGSGIERYSWCVGATQNDDDCDILPIKNVGMHTSVSTRIQNPTHNGEKNVDLLNKFLCPMIVNYVGIR